MAKSDSEQSGIQQMELNSTKLADKVGPPVLWVDVMHMSLRAEPAIGMLRFWAIVPPDEREGSTAGRVEILRLQSSITMLIQMVNVICRTTGYRPDFAALEAEWQAEGNAEKKAKS